MLNVKFDSYMDYVRQSDTRGASEILELPQKIQDKIDEFFESYAGSSIEDSKYNPDNLWINHINYIPESFIAKDVGLDEFDKTDERHLSKAVEYYEDDYYILGFWDGDLYYIE